MKPSVSLTQRDFVASVIYALLVFNLLSYFLNFLSHLAFSRIIWLQPSIAMPPWEYYAINLGNTFIFVLAFLPFVSLIARVVTGREALRVVSRRHFLPLTFQCLGMMLFVMPLSTLVCEIVDPIRLVFFSGSSLSSGSPYYLQKLVSMLVTSGMGIIIAFSPSLLAALRFAKRNDETAA